MAKKSKYKTVSIPTGITDAIEEVMDELSYWPSLGSFVREAALDKLRKERRLLRARDCFTDDAFVGCERRGRSL